MYNGQKGIHTDGFIPKIVKYYNSPGNHIH